MEDDFYYEDIIVQYMISHLIICIQCVNLNTFIRVFIETGLFINVTLT